jgi:uncharacterized protein with ParB-like and HNH nuclease domain
VGAIAMKINSVDKDVKAILGYNYYCIPRFQRPYRWLRENISDYWNDTIAESDGDYFIGSIVVYKIGGDIYGIVDGQQRLTTITMMLCAIRNALKDEGFDDLANGVHRFIERPNIDNKPVYVLSTETSYPYYQEYIQKFGAATVEVKPKEEEKNLETAFEQIREFVRESMLAIKTDPTIAEDLKIEKVKNKLVDIRDRILSPKLIFVELDNEDDAFIIFETLNTRGKDLDVSDLVKNYLTKLIKPTNIGVDTAKIQWERIVSTIEGSSAELSVDTFLHHYWLSHKDYVTVKKLFKKVKKEIKNKKSNAQSFLNQLEKEAITYREINETAAKKWRKEESSMKGSLDAYRLFKVKQEIPMVISVMRDYKKGIIKTKDATNILNAIENFHCIFTAVTSQRSSGGISQMYASSARDFAAANTREKKLSFVKDLRKKLKTKIPSYQEFEANFKEICYTDKITKQKDLVKYILSKIHAYYTQDKVIDYDLMTIEHILPQSEIGKNDINEKDVGQIGNLILVPSKLNTELGKKNFLDKKRILESKNVLLDEKVKNVTSWGKQQIEERTKWLAENAYSKIWKIK